MSNPVDYDTALRLLDKLALRYAETHDRSLVNKMAELDQLLAILQTREARLASKRPSFFNHRAHIG
jgi:hypothetical protein